MIVPSIVPPSLLASFFSLVQSDRNTGFSLVESDHVTRTMASDWLTTLAPAPVTPLFKTCLGRISRCMRCPLSRVTTDILLLIGREWSCDLDTDFMRCPLSRDTATWVFWFVMWRWWRVSSRRVVYSFVHNHKPSSFLTPGQTKSFNSVISRFRNILRHSDPPALDQWEGSIWATWFFWTNQKRMTGDHDAR